ncbi:hypothetical protein [Paractinoplanes toevensis]|uniref:Uncharacterized protein n=1 Tax=Paractinoplanes toevensis TaxID=571911 RepID=A0A919T7I3_9ACTN|nr:hypothetical protein [Actinoplanes toevensis]GIM90127.1 hypothetical protein Ato02nite_019200 [Actinoplanes toevensis]
MRDSNDDKYPFDTDNRAWQRLLALASEHFEVLTWAREDGRPAILSLVHVSSGDTISLTVLDSLEVSDPHVLLAVHTDGRLTAHGTVAGPATALEYAPDLVLTDGMITATVAVPVHNPTDANIAPDAWRHLPDDLADRLLDAPPETGACMVVLLDRAGHRLAAGGSFLSPASASAWKPGDDAVEWFLVPLYPIVADRHR